MKFSEGETSNVCQLQISKLTWSYKHREEVLVTQTKQICVNHGISPYIFTQI